MIKPDGEEWVLYTVDGETELGRFATKEEAEEREREIEEIEHAKAEAGEGTGKNAYSTPAKKAEAGEGRQAEACPTFVITLGEVGAGLVRIPLAVLGRWVKGALKFSITKADFADIVRNFRKRGTGDLVIDYEHGQEFGIGTGQAVPASGWLKEIEDGPDERGVLWGRAEFTDRARGMIAAREYRYLSPSIDWAARDKATGAQQGATLTSVALVNRPFLEALPAIALSEGWREDGETRQEDVMVTKVVLADRAAGMVRVIHEDGQEKTLPIEGLERQPTVIRLSDVGRTQDGRLDFAALAGKGDALIAAEVFHAEQAQAALDEAVSKGLILPAQRKHYEALALSDLAGFRELAKTMKPQVDLSERGIAGGGGEGGDLKTVDRKIEQLVDEKQRANPKLEYDQALNVVLSEHPDLKAQRRELMR